MKSYDTSAKYIALGVSRSKTCLQKLTCTRKLMLRLNDRLFFIFQSTRFTSTTTDSFQSSKTSWKDDDRF